MKNLRSKPGPFAAFAILMLLALACSDAASGPDWAGSKRIAGKDKGLSHVSGMAVDGKFAYAIIGGTIADRNEGTSGLRKIDLESGVVTVMEQGERIPQSDQGGIAVDDKYVYWNAGGIVRMVKDGGPLEMVASESVGIGIDMAMDDEKIYWANHGYYTSGKPPEPKPIYAVAKAGGTPQKFADGQMVPHNVIVDEKFVYWLTLTSIVRQAKSGGASEIVYETSGSEGLDELGQDADSLYFGHRGPNESRWALRKISKKGGEPVTLVKTYLLSPVAVDESSVYFFDEEGRSKMALCRISKNGGEVVRLDKGYASGAIAVDKAQVYFAGLDDIFCLRK